MKASDFIANFLSKHSKFAFGGQGSSVIHIVDSIHKNRTYVFTGCRAKDDLKEDIISNGGTVEDRIKKGVTHLVVKDGNYKHTSKVKAAISKGIQIITLDSIS